jgi:2-keto-3-deoxy-L-fuconate dehydrogenase
MTGRLQAKVALVTAAGQGIGRAIAEAFVTEGAKVIATDVEVSKIADLAGATHHKLDVRSTPVVEALAKVLARDSRPLNVLVNCAGFVHNGNVLACTEVDWNFSFDLNVTSIHRTLRAFLPGMLANGGGSIINISSAVSSIRGVPDRYAYGATKAAIIGLTKAVAADFIRQGVRANAICPGTIQSPSLDQRIATLARASGRSPAEVRQDFVDRQAMGRLGTPAEVAALAVFLASDESSFVTGQPHLVDGGMAL